MQTEVLSPRRDLYQTVTDKIIAALEAGVSQYCTPWHTPGAPFTLPLNAYTNAEYRGINILGLWIAAQERGYSQNVWASYRQWLNLGAQVRKGERGSLVIFYKRLEERRSEDTDHEPNTKLRYVARASWVFNALQVHGYEQPEAPKGDVERCREAEAFVEATGATVRHGFSMACYNRKADLIEMPEAEWFLGTETSSATESYYSTLFHELTHWTGAPSRLNRVFGAKYGDDAYAMEELVAELGAAFASAAFGIANDPRPDHAAYLAHWLTILKYDSRAIFTAASKAQEAFDHLCYLATKNDEKAA